MKQEIIDFVMFTLPFHWIPQWSPKAAKEFCKLILDGEGIDYQEKDIDKNFTYGTGNMKEVEVVSRYAKMYREIYKTNDIQKMNMMNQIVTSCDQILGSSQSLDAIFSGKDKKETEQEITIKKGESIRFSNGAGSNLTPKELEHLMKATFSEEQQEKPFTIQFSASVSEECREEVINRVTAIFEEVRAEMSGKVK